MTRRREPVAEIGAEDYRIVRHTHDIALATRLMRAAMRAENGCYWCRPGYQVCLHKIDVGRPQQVMVRIVHALPNSYAAFEGWYGTFQEGATGRGAFPAVVFS